MSRSSSSTCEFDCGDAWFLVEPLEATTSLRVDVLLGITVSDSGGEKFLGHFHSLALSSSLFLAMHMALSRFT
jgi:hypothetical protein